ncbi:MAG TPA: molybdate ABC transporter substrate-binding protein [Nocardioidaceae bacterium]|jgi:molybdate transport system substrate-binding protein
MKVIRPIHRRTIGAGSAALLLAACLVSCSDGDGGGGDTTQLTVFAAASLTEAFTTLEKDFEKDHSDVDVVTSFGSSTDLATQVTEGSPADVIATADDKSMGIVTDAGDLDGEPTQFATNTLIVVTPPDNPGNVRSLGDLQHADYVVCDPSVPCGAAAATILDNAGITAKPKSLEEDVKAVLTKVTLGEADAGIVYVTDAQAAGDKVSTVDIAPDVNVVNPYFIGVIKDSGESHLAQEWVDLVTSQAGQSVLQQDGFGAAP